MSIFSERLKWLRNRKGLTQAQMGELLGISDRAYAKYEYKLREPNLETLVKLPAILGESLDFITGIKDTTYEIDRLFSNLALYKGSVDTQKEIISRAVKIGLTEEEVRQYEERLQYYIQKSIETLRKIEELEAEIPKET